MFSHLTIGSNDIARAKRFYDAALAPLGLVAFASFPDGIGYGATGQRPQSRAVRREVWAKAGAAGLLLPAVPDEYGGGGGDFLHSAVVMEEVSRIGATGIGFPLHSDIVAPYVLHYGSEEQKKTWLPKMARGDT